MRPSAALLRRDLAAPSRASRHTGHLPMLLYFQRHTKQKDGDGRVHYVPKPGTRGWFKRFTKHVDENGQVYHVQNQRPSGERHIKDLYQISTVLLDLDAEGARDVRTFGPEDEELLASRWAIENEPSMREVNGKVAALEAQLHDARDRVKSIASDPNSTWRLSFHDLLSAALRDSPTSHQPGHETVKDPNQTLSSSDAIIPSLGEDTSLQGLVASKNGIPPHAAHQDGTLLQWLELRYTQLKHAQPDVAGASPAKDFVGALEKQTSIAGIRRLVFQNIAAGLDLIKHSKRKSSHNVSNAIRSACLRVLLRRGGDDTSEKEQVLTLIANIHRRVAKGDKFDDFRDYFALAPLWGLALRLSVQLCEFEVSHKLLKRAFNVDMASRTKVRQDVFLCLKSTADAVGSGQLEAYQNVRVREDLFRMFTGLTMPSLDCVSFRQFCFLCLGESEFGVDSEQAFNLFAAYMSVLGHLGATKTLWSDWVAAAPLIRDRMARAESKPLTAATVEAALERAFKASSRVSGSPVDSAWTRDSLKQNLTADYMAIETQDPAVWQLDLTDEGLELDPATREIVDAAKALLHQKEGG